MSGSNAATIECKETQIDRISGWVDGVTSRIHVQAGNIDALCDRLESSQQTDAASNDAPREVPCGALARARVAVNDVEGAGNALEAAVSRLLEINLA